MPVKKAQTRPTMISPSECNFYMWLCLDSDPEICNTLYNTAQSKGVVNYRWFWKAELLQQVKSENATKTSWDIALAETKFKSKCQPSSEVRSVICHKKTSSLLFSFFPCSSSWPLWSDGKALLIRFDWLSLFPVKPISDCFSSLIKSWQFEGPNKGVFNEIQVWLKKERWWLAEKLSTLI